MNLTVVIPVYNEKNTLEEIVKRVEQAVKIVPLKIIVVDDGSDDGTTEVVQSLQNDGRVAGIFHSVNQGKGAAIQSAFARIETSIVIIQDADLEYDPSDIERVIQPILEGRADVVYGSRFHGEVQRVHFFWHRLANAFLTLFSNMLTNLNLTDMECGYKAFRSEVVNRLKLREKGFGIEPEITAKIAKLRIRIYEVPVSYHGRDYSEGKKIRFKDALRAVWCIIRYRFAD